MERRPSGHVFTLGTRWNELVDLLQHIALRPKLTAHEPNDLRPSGVLTSNTQPAGGPRPNGAARDHSRRRCRRSWSACTARARGTRTRCTRSGRGELLRSAIRSSTRSAHPLERAAESRRSGTRSGGSLASSTPISPISSSDKRRLNDDQVVTRSNFWEEPGA
jgi:hypothetical protein